MFPTVTEQYELALINNARANPQAEVNRLANDPSWPATPGLNEGVIASEPAITPDPKPPLAFNLDLIDSATLHSQWQITNQTFSHDEGTVDDIARDIAAGYVFVNGQYGGENIGILTNTDANPSAAALEAEAGFFIDGMNLDPGVGHRENLLDAGYNEIGLGLVDGSLMGGNSVITEDFANAGNGSFLTGFAINDVDQTGQYAPGEGLGGVTITATRTSDNMVFSTTTWAAGGYTLPLAPGTYVVTASGGNIGNPAPQTVTIGATNVEADFIEVVQPPATPTAPTITAQPTSQTVAIGNAVSFAMQATGNPQPTVQWQVSTDGVNFTNIAGATGQVYTFTPTAAQSGSIYQAVVTNSQGTVTTTTATLTVSGLPLTLVTQPMSQIANAGDSVTFTASATGSGPTAQWSVSTDGGNTYTAIPGATSSSYTLTADPSLNGNWYEVTFTDIAGASTSAFASLTVNAAPAAPAVVAQPQATAATDGGTATLAVAATGFPAATMQWQVCPPATTATPARFRADTTQPDFTDITGATGSTLTIPVSMDDNREKYRVVLTNDEGTVTSEEVTLTVNKKTPLANDLTSLQQEAAAGLQAITTCGMATASEVAALSGDLRKIHASASAEALVKTLAERDLVTRTTLKHNETRELGVIEHDANLVNLDSIRLGKQPTNAAYKTKLMSDIAALQAAAAASTVPSDASQCEVAKEAELAPLENVDTTDSKLQADIEASYTSSINIGQVLQAPMAIVQEIITRVETAAQD